MFSQNSKSFTLIELMTVVAIMAILSGITLIGFNLFLKQGKIAKSMAFDSSIHFNLGWAIVGDWKMDDNAANSTVVDTSGYNNDGTFVDATNPNTSYHSVDGANGTALEFDGVDDYVDAGNDESLNITKNLTVSTWVKFNYLDYTNSNGELLGIAGKGNPDNSAPNSGWWFDYENRNNNNDFRYLCFGNTEGGHQGGGNNFGASSYTFTENTWYHIAFTIESNGDAGEGRLYINGNQIGPTESFVNLSLSNTSKNLAIGQDSSGHEFNGTIDQVRIYSEAFSLSQVKYQYYTGLQRLYEKGLMSGKEYKSRIVKLNSES